MSLFDAPAVIEAAGACLREGHPHFVYSDGSARDVLNAALAALPREELVEKAARAIYDHDVRSYPASCWNAEGAACRAAYRDRAARIFIAIGLIPEHVTPKEER